MVPRLDRPIQGCPFAPRCDFATNAAASRRRREDHGRATWRLLEVARVQAVAA